MSRLYKKCVIASSGLHVLLVVILVVCPAFLASTPKQSDVQPITFIPDILNDGNFAGGGNPNAGRAPSAHARAAGASGSANTRTCTARTEAGGQGSRATQDRRGIAGGSQR